MAKDPAFLFYPGDWLGGTITFNRHHKGAYMDLLMAQFNSGHMELQDIEFVLGNDFSTMWESKLKSKFIQDSDGKYYNQKLENEIFKRKNFAQSRKDNLNSTKKTKPHISTHMDTHMENENENENRNEKQKGVQGEKELFGNHGIMYTEEKSSELEHEIENNFSQHESLVTTALDTYKLTISTHDVIKLIPTFIKHLKDTSSFPLTDKEAKKYFGNWFKLKLKDHVKSNNSSSSNGQGRSNAISQSYRERLLADLQSGINEAATKEAS
jgi:hypothetical protein